MESEQPLTLKAEMYGSQGNFLCLSMHSSCPIKIKNLYVRDNDTLYYPINAHSGQKQPGNFDEILQAKAKLRNYLIEKY